MFATAVSARWESAQWESAQYAEHYQQVLEAERARTRVWFGLGGFLIVVIVAAKVVFRRRRLEEDERWREREGENAGGAALRTCPACGAQNELSWKVCDACGATLKR
ncbi:MAG: zinc-ribbon domain-containing protein [Myxococcota bacterium]